MSFDTPSVPDPQTTAAAQTATNVNTAIANAELGNVNQITPQYSLTYEQTGQSWIPDPKGSAKNDAGERGYYVPQFTATTSLTEPYQAIEDNNVSAQQSLSGLAADQSSFLRDYLSKPFTLSGAPDGGDLSAFNAQFDQGLSMGPERGTLDGMPMTYGDPNSAARVQDVQDALFSRLNEQLEQDRGAMDARLAAQGIAQGSDAYRRAYDDFGEQSNDARMSAILAASQEDSRLQGIARDMAEFERGGYVLRNADMDADSDAMFGREAAGAGFDVQTQQAQNQAALAEDAALDADRARFIEEAAFERNQPINEIISLLSGTQLGGPNFQPISMPTIPTTDVAGITQQGYQNQLNASQLQQQLPLAMLGGLSNVGMGYFMGR